MARRKKRSTRKFNPTGLETGFISIGAALVGGLGGFWLASWACGKLMKTAYDEGVIEPGPYATMQGVMGPPGGG